ncbi:PucR family transcriptional regulator [Actinomadura yumaensis]|uniref:PucR family transcriptional regulator n=1 Tax=Actinomadura yumaensis TaxID=111807 RepID=UPI00361F37DE
MEPQDLVESLAARLGRAVVLYDASLNLVAFSAQDGETDEPRRTIVLARNASAAARALIRESGASRASAPVRIPPYEPTGARGRVVYAVRHRGHPHGYLTYIDDAPAETPVPPADAAALDAVHDDLGRALARRLLRERRARTRAGRLLDELLSDEPSRHQAAEALLDESLIAAAPPYVVAVVRPGLDHRPRASEVRLAIEESLNDLTAFSPARSPGRCAATTASWSSPTTPRPPSTASPPRSRAWSSERAPPPDPPRDPRRLPRGADLSRNGPPHPRNAPRPLGRHRREPPPRPPPLDRLTRADLPQAVQTLLEAGNGLPETLESYLDHACDAQATARTLTIHRSTLYYRLGRIKSLTGADLTNGTQRLELHLALKVATLATLY